MIRQDFIRQVAGLVLATCFSFELGASATPEYTVRWERLRTKAPAVILTSNDRNGVVLIHRHLARAKHPSYLLSVSILFKGSNPGDMPALSGRWKRIPEGVKFEPEFPLTPGLKYQAAFRTPDDTKVTRVTKMIPREKLMPRASVSAIYPSSNVLPENLLKFYLHFSHPMSRGDIYRHITLLDSSDQPVELPFLEIGEELWDPEQRRLTLLIDPGRIKRGVRPLEDIGPAIESGKRYTLHISHQWQDGRGVPLKTDHRKSFRVGPPDRSPPNPVSWHITRPTPNTREPLKIRFPESLDHALASRVIWIEDSAGKPMNGEVSLAKEETQWMLKPDAPWKPGRYHLRAELILEDHAGNSIGRPFEVDIFERVDDGIKEIPFGRSFKIGN